MQEDPDLVVLPETPWPVYLNRELRELPVRHSGLVELARLQHEELHQLAEANDAYITIGSLSREPQPEGTYPLEHKYNSAFVYAPDISEPDRYDKIHLVLFGEYVPFRYSRHFHWLYRFLNDGPWNPWGRGGNEYSLTPGSSFHTFRMYAASRQDHPFSFGITICYEDVIPQVFRRFVAAADGRKRVDFMLNISNDGWFGRGTQQAQHLVACAFRAVENRVSVARAVNTGVSGFIDPSGTWHDLVGASATEPRVGGTGLSLSRMVIDPRVTFYSRRGDVFALGCTILAGLALAEALVVRFKRRGPARSKEQIARNGVHS
jgi:apolipoprotein N-acyltransferase